jgi:hypothetical protein
MLVPGIAVRPMTRQIGLGLMATRRFEAGELVWREAGLPRGRERTYAEVMAIGEPGLTIYKHFMYQTGPDGFESLPQFDVLPVEQWAAARPDDLSMYMNHSCDPTVWYPNPDRFEFVTRRLVEPGEWITYDYAMTETVDNQPWTCGCGSPLCRGRVVHTDWQLASVRQAYFGHVARHVQVLMERAEAA